MIKILHLFTTLDNGGVESFLYNYYSKMDHNKIRFDFVVPCDDIGFLENKMIDFGGCVYHVAKFKVNPLKQINQLNKIMKNGNYDVVHCHGYKSILGIILAKKNGIKVRIMHSHMAYVKENFFSCLFRKIVVFIINRLATDKFACGIDAAKWLYGESDYNNGSVKIINNAIDLKRFRYNNVYRDEIRSELSLNIDNEILIGNIARLTEQKNQMYSLKIMKTLISEGYNAKLILVGNGEDKEKLVAECQKLNIVDSVYFLGVRTDISKILSALDVFILPSLYEGLPVVLAEVQASGLNCLVSSSVTKEISLTSNIEYLDLDNNVDQWIKEIKKMCNNRVNRIKCNDMMKRGKYDVEYQADKLFEFYQMKCIGGQNER